MDHDPFPPLISSRSPSYERAWREFPHPSEQGVAETVALLSRLSEAEHNAYRTCAQLAQVVEEDELAEEVRDMADLHGARRLALGKLIARFGGSAPTEGECRTILTRTSDAADLAQTDAAAESVIALLREELGAEYDAAQQNPCLDAEQRSALAALAPLRP